MTMRVAMLAAECEPWAKTGGLADVVDALARALGRLPGAGTDLDAPVDVFLPRYRSVPVPADADAEPVLRIDDPDLRRPGATIDVSIVDVAADGYRLRLVDVPAAFDRDGVLRPSRRPVAVRRLLPRGDRGPAPGRPAARRPPRPRLAHRARAHRARPRRPGGGRRSSRRPPSSSRSTTSPTTAGRATRLIGQLGPPPGRAARGRQPRTASTSCSRRSSGPRSRTPCRPASPARR